jgi:hypothetical protein
VAVWFSRRDTNRRFFNGLLALSPKWAAEKGAWYAPGMGFERGPRPWIDPPDRGERWVRAIELGLVVVPLVFLVIGLLLPK